MAFKPTTRDECYCCRYPDIPVMLIEPEALCRDDNPKPMPMCELCYRTMVGVWVPYRSVHDATKVELGRHINWLANHILASLQASQPAPLAERPANWPNELFGGLYPGEV